MNFETPYSHTRARSALFATINEEESMTQQSDALDLDINVIMARHAQTGQVPQLVSGASYADFTGVTDYRDAIDKLRETDALFQTVPAKIRGQFSNDPKAFFAFVNDPANKEELIKMGLASPPPKAVPSPEETTQITPEPPPAPAPSPPPNNTIRK